MADDTETNQEIDRLRRDIAGTRADMELTIEEIEEHVRPRNVVQRQRAAAQERLAGAVRRRREQLESARRDVRGRVDGLPVLPAAGATAGLASSALVTGLVRRRQARIRAQQERAARTGAAVRALAALGALLGIVRLAGYRRSGRATSVRVREIMTSAPAALRRSDTALEAVRRMRDLDVGALPVCSRAGRVQGMVTDRDVVVNTVAAGRALAGTPVRKVMSTRPATISVDADAAAALRTMTRNKVRRLPVVDTAGKLVGIVTQADVAVRIDDRHVGDLVESISAAP